VMGGGKFVTRGGFFGWSSEERQGWGPRRGRGRVDSRKKKKRETFCKRRRIRLQVKENTLKLALAASRIKKRRRSKVDVCLINEKLGNRGQGEERRVARGKKTAPKGKRQINSSNWERGDYRGVDPPPKKKNTKGKREIDHTRIKERTFPVHLDVKKGLVG